MCVCVCYSTIYPHVKHTTKFRQLHKHQIVFGPEPRNQKANFYATKVVIKQDLFSASNIILCGSHCANKYLLVVGLWLSMMGCIVCISFLCLILMNMGSHKNILIRSGYECEMIRASITNTHIWMTLRGWSCMNAAAHHVNMPLSVLPALLGTDQLQKKGTTTTTANGNLERFQWNIM